VRIGICALVPVLLGAPPGAAIAAPNYDFGYRVSGDRRVAPQQVFDDGASTYLQFYPGQVLPALIAVGSDGSQRLLTHAQLGPYVTVPGTHVALVAQLGSVRAVIDYGGKAARVAGDDSPGAIAPPIPQPAAAAAPTSQGVPFAPPWASAVTAAAPVPASTAITPAVRTSLAASATPTPLAPEPARGAAPGLAASRDAPRVGPAAAPSARDSAPSLPSAANVPRDIVGINAGATTDASVVAEPWPAANVAAKPFEATLADQNLRRALGRWAAQAGWTFRAEHWTPDIDVAVSAPAVFGPDFKTAVRGLLAGTELSARPLQPCFYSNLVLRVVSQAERCDRRVAH
jgi:hypothetical protein